MWKPAKVKIIVPLIILLFVNVDIYDLFILKRNSFLKLYAAFIICIQNYFVITGIIDVEVKNDLYG